MDRRNERTLLERCVPEATICFARERALGRHDVVVGAFFVGDAAEPKVIAIRRDRAIAHVAKESPHLAERLKAPAAPGAFWLVVASDEGIGVAEVTVCVLTGRPSARSPNEAMN